MKKVIKNICFAGYVALCSMLVLGVNGAAYIDPSVTTYMIQIVAGVVVAVGATAGILFRRLKKKVNNKLGIDENQKKEMESDDIEFKKND